METHDPMCRLCLKKNMGKFTVNIFAKKNAISYKRGSKYFLQEVITQFTTVTPIENDSFPQEICKECYDTINLLVKFRMTCLKSEEYFKKQIKYEKNADDLAENIDLEPNVVVKIKEEDKDDSDYHCDGNDEEEIEEDEKDSVKVIVRTVKKRGRPPNVKLDLDPKPIEIKQKKIRYNKSCCEICGKIYGGKKMEYHMNEHTGMRPFKCKEAYCTKSFKSPELTRKHFITCHGNNYKHECTICKKKYKTKIQYDNHMTYHKPPEIPCKICRKLIRNMGEMTRHLKTHTGERPHPCDQCSKSFQNRYTLNIHMRVHTKEKPFVCTKCGESFSYKCLLKAHSERYHLEQN